ncbi:MAG: helix-turn-helix domain-containing protein [Chitinophagaceae bacterium]
MSKTRNVEIKNRQGFTQVSNNMLSDPNISYKAKGILCHLLSHDQDKFTITSETLIRHSSDGERSIKSGLDELKKNGYLQITREAGDKGRWKYILNMFGNKFTDTHKTTEWAKTDLSVLGVCNNKNNNLKNNNLKEKESEEKKASEPSPANIITSSSQLTPNQLAQGFKSTRQIKETIYQYLQSKGIPISPGADEQAIEKHRLTDPSELIFKIQRLEKLDYLKRNWREWENWIDRTQIPLFQKLELQAGSISWALSNYSTDIDPLYNLIESFIRRREREERHKQAEREKQEALREENYRKLREQEPIQDIPSKSIIERVQERSKPLEPEEAFQPIVRNFTEEQKARMTELLLKRDRTLEENIELNELMGRRV